MISGDIGPKCLGFSAEKRQIQILHGGENRNLSLKGVYVMFLDKWLPTFRKNLPPYLRDRTLKIL